MITGDFLLGFLSCSLLVTFIGVVFTFVDLYQRYKNNRRRLVCSRVNTYWCQCDICIEDRRKRITESLDTQVIKSVKGIRKINR